MTKGAIAIAFAKVNPDPMDMSPGPCRAVVGARPPVRGCVASVPDLALRTCRTPVAKST